MTHEDYMRQALRLAERGRGYVNPNPMVGALIVKDGEVIGEGWHRAYGELHAERNALAACTGSPEGATMYVTLEPCCHHGKTPPCTDAILDSGISTVVVGSADPNPKVAGKGLAILRGGGITVVENVLRAECDRLNAVFLHYIQKKTPYVVMKYAMTADGKIAARTGDAKWISCEQSRAEVQRTRHALSGIMVGIGTVLADDPLLTCRLPEGKSPARIICDSRLRTPVGSRVVRSAKGIPTYIAHAGGDWDKRRQLLDAGCRLLHLPGKDGRVDLPRLMEVIHGEEIDSVLLEGGGGLNYSMLERGLVQRVQVYLAPNILGGAGAPSPVGGLGVDSPPQGFALSSPTVTAIGKDLRIEYDILERN